MIGKLCTVAWAALQLEFWDAQHVRAEGRLPCHSTLGSQLTDWLPCRLPLCGVPGPKVPRHCAMPAVSWCKAASATSRMSQGFNVCQCSALMRPAQHKICVCLPSALAPKGGCLCLDLHCLLSPRTSSS